MSFWLGPLYFWGGQFEWPLWKSESKYTFKKIFETPHSRTHLKQWINTPSELLCFSPQHPRSYSHVESHFSVHDKCIEHRVFCLVGRTFSALTYIVLEHLNRNSHDRLDRYPVGGGVRLNNWLGFSSTSLLSAQVGSSNFSTLRK